MVLRQQSLARWDVGTANFSGITPLGGNRYAVVSDKEPEDGFFVLRIDQNRFSGAVIAVYLEGFYGTKPRSVDAYGNSRRDTEGIAYHPQRQTIWISGEGDQAILEYDLDGRATGLSLAVPTMMANAGIYHNAGFEALCYDGVRHCFWTTTENSLRRDGLQPGREFPRGYNRLRLQAFGDDLQPLGQYAYCTDAGTVDRFGRGYISGVPALCALPDGRLLVMEREGHFTDAGIGSFVCVKIYAVRPEARIPITAKLRLSDFQPEEFLPKTLVAEWTTRLHLTRYDLANYEGFCLGASLADGRQTLLCINDSQAGRGNSFLRLKDYLRVVVLGD